MIQVHTLVLQIQIHPKAIFDRMWQYLRGTGGNNWQFKFAKQGILKMEFPQKQEVNYYGIRLKIDPARLINAREYSLTPIAMMRTDFVKALDAWLQTWMQKEMVTALDWSVCRIDYAIDLEMESEAEALTYGVLARNAFLPKGMKNLYKQATHNLHVHNKQEGFQIYPKGKQIRDRYPNTHEAICCHYDKVIRIEAQIKKSMLIAIDKQAGRSGRLLGFYLHEGIADSILRKRLLEVFSPCGTHKTLTGAIQTVAAAYTNRKISKSEKEKMILFLKKISDQSLEMARNNCVTPIGPIKTRSTFNKYVAQLTELGVALPLLPANCPLPALKPLFGFGDKVIDRIGGFAAHRWQGV